MQKPVYPVGGSPSNIQNYYTECKQYVHFKLGIKETPKPEIPPRPTYQPPPPRTPEEQKEIRRVQSKKYYEANKGKIIQHQREYYQANKDKMREKCREKGMIYRERHRDEINFRHRQWYLANWCSSINKRRGETVVCDHCGEITTKQNMSLHSKTSKCLTHSFLSN